MEILAALDEAIRECREAALRLETGRLREVVRRLEEASGELAAASCNSWAGYQSGVYTVGLRPARPGEVFDTEWGGMEAFGNITRGEWGEYEYGVIVAVILERAGVSEAELDELGRTAAEIVSTSNGVKTALLPVVDAFLTQRPDATLQAKRNEMAALETSLSREEIAKAMAPGQIMSRDRRAMQGGIRPPHHVGFQCSIYAQGSAMTQAKALADLAEYT